MCHVRRPITQDINGKQTTTKSPWAIERVQEATKLNAETRDPPSPDPRDHKEQPSRHDIHPEANADKARSQQSGEKSYRSETGE